MVRFLPEVAKDIVLNSNTLRPLARTYMRAVLDLNYYKIKSRVDLHTLERLPPLGLDLNVVDFCNSNCVFCAYHLTRPRGIVMSIRIYEKAVREFARMGGGSVSHNGLVGDPLLDPTLFDKLRISSSYPEVCSRVLFTNGILLSQDKNVEKILESGISKLFISVSDFEETSYKRIFRVDKYHEVLEGIRLLITRSNEMKNSIEVFLNVRTNKNSREVLSSDDYKRIIAPLFDRDHIAISRWFDSWCGQIQEENLLNNMYMKPDPHIRSLPCERTFYLGILPDGYVRACPCRFGRKGTHDELIVGNIAENSLEQIWAGRKMREIRESFLENELPEVCGNCNDYTYPSLKQYTLKKTLIGMNNERPS